MQNSAGAREAELTGKDLWKNCNSTGENRPEYFSLCMQFSSEVTGFWFDIQYAISHSPPPLPLSPPPR